MERITIKKGDTINIVVELFRTVLLDNVMKLDLSTVDLATTPTRISRNLAVESTQLTGTGNNGNI